MQLLDVTLYSCSSILGVCTLVITLTTWCNLIGGVEAHGLSDFCIEPIRQDWSWDDRASIVFVRPYILECQDSVMHQILLVNPKVTSHSDHTASETVIH